MGCGASTSILPENAISYDNELVDRLGSKTVRSSESYDSGVGYELGSKETSSCEDSLLPDIRHLQRPTFADRRPLPPHPFEASFTERTVERLPALRPPNEVNHEVERLLQPPDREQEFMVSGQPLRPLRGLPKRAAGAKHSEIAVAVSQSRRHGIENTQREGPKGDHLLYDLHRSVDPDTQVAARPPSRGGLAFDLVFGEQEELAEKVERLKKRQRSKAPKLPKKAMTKAQVQKKLIAADLRRQQQTLDTLTKLSETHSNVEEIGNRTSKMEEMKRNEMKRAQQVAMNKALAARRQHLEEMRDRIRAKNDRIKVANQNRYQAANQNRYQNRPPTSAGRASSQDSNKLPQLLGF